MKRFTLIAIAFSAVVVLVGCGTNPVTGKPEVQAVSYAQAGEAGHNAAADVEGEFGGQINDPQLNAYLQQIGMRLVAQLPSDMTDRMGGYQPEWRFTALDSEIINAFALPNGYMYFTKGILLAMRDEAELAAVMGHEITHVAAGHTRDQLQKTVGIQVLIEAAGIGGGGGAGAAAQVAGALVTLKFSREHEYQSDEYGMEWMSRAGYNPWGMVDLQKMLLEQGGGGGSDILSTHPSSDKRIQAAEEIIRTRYPTAQQSGKDQNQTAFMNATARLRS